MSARVRKLPRSVNQVTAEDRRTVDAISFRNYGAVRADRSRIGGTAFAIGKCVAECTGRFADRCATGRSACTR